MLFDKNELNCDDNKMIDNSNVVSISKVQSNAKVYHISDKCDLSKYLHSFNDDIEIISNGAFSMHQLVQHIVSIISSPCTIYATTWATSEKVVSMLISMKQKGLIENCYFLFDHRVLRYRPNAYVLFNQNFQCKILSIHAKICVIESKNLSIRIIGSGNWTRNDKIEVYSISSNPETCKFYKNYIKNELTRTN